MRPRVGSRMLRSHGRNTETIYAKEGDPVITKRDITGAQGESSGGLRAAYDRDPLAISASAPATHAALDALQSRWPLLARLPDVAARRQEGPASGERSAETVGPSRSVGYRVDPAEARTHAATPLNQASSVRGTRVAATLARETTLNGAEPSARTLAPRAFPRLAADAPRESRPAASAALLPNSDLFASGDSNLQDALAPLIRFLVLVALFTIAGTSVLMMYRAAPTSELEASPHSSATVKSSKSKTIRNAPTAIGPINRSLMSAELVGAPAKSGSKARRDGDSLARKTKAIDRSPASETSGEATDVDSPRILSPNYPTTGLPAVATPTGELPRVHAAEAPTEIARLSGSIGTVIADPPTLQAEHDDHESSLH